MSTASAATIGCRSCATDCRLDDTNVVRCAQIAAFVAAHRHPDGFAVSLTIAVTGEGETSPDIVLDPWALRDSSDTTAR